MQLRRDQEPSLAAADHDDRGVEIGIGARFGETIEPICGAALEFFFVAPEFVQIRVQRPGAQPALAIGDKAENAVSRAKCSREFEDCLNAFAVRTADPAQRRAARRNTKIRGLCAGKRLSRHRLDRRPACHGLDVPSKSQHIAPEAIDQEQLGCHRGIVRLQGRFECHEPVRRPCGVRRGRSSTKVIGKYYCKAAACTMRWKRRMAGAARAAHSLPVVGEGKRRVMRTCRGSA